MTNERFDANLRARSNRHLNAMWDVTKIAHSLLCENAKKNPAKKHHSTRCSIHAAPERLTHVAYEPNGSDSDDP